MPKGVYERKNKGNSGTVSVNTGDGEIKIEVGRTYEKRSILHPGKTEQGKEYRFVDYKNIDQKEALGWRLSTGEYSKKVGELVKMEMPKRQYEERERQKQESITKMERKTREKAERDWRRLGGSK